MATFRPATKEDIPSLVSLLADDPLGATREDVTNLEPYHKAFDAIAADPNQLLVVAECDYDTAVVGTLQLTFVPGLSRMGTKRALIEAVRIAPAERGTGLGRLMFQWAFARAREAGCTMVQLTCDKGRPDAHRFYEMLGFVGSHTGFKMAL